MARVAFIGLGVMGYPMAGHLAAKGHEVTVFNRTAAKAEAWTAQHGGARAETPAAAAEIMANRVNVDTGAYMGGTLTALVVDGAAKRLIHA